MTTAEQYASWVLDPANANRTGRLIKLAAKRFLSDLKRDDIYFDEKEANRCINFIERYCLQWEGAWRGESFKLELWQKFALQNIYGWIRKNGKRRFTKAYIQISKKNGKSTLSAGVSLFHLLADQRINTPKVFTAANNEEQAKICVNIAGRIAESSPEILEQAAVRFMMYKENITEVLYDDEDRGNGFIKALSKEGSDKTSKTSGGKHGINASLGVVDEFGMSQDHGNSKTIDSSMVSRPERLMLYITTAGYNLEGPCYKELRDSGIKVLEGTIDMDSYFMMIFEIDKPISDDGKPSDITVDWLLNNPDIWEQSNPNIDVSVQRDALVDALKEAKQYGGTTEVECLTLNFNIWVNSSSAFISADVWNRNTHGLIHADLEGEPCYGGIEIVGGKYLNCFALLFPDIQGKTVIKPIFWMPDEYVKSNESDQYRKWVQDGFITTFLGNVSDNDKVFELIMEEISKYQMHSFAFKTNLANNDIVQALIKNGIQGNPISHGYQGISTPTLAWEELLTGCHVEHFNNPVLAWMNSNCTAVRKDNDIRLEKSGSKVVGIYAGINALAQWKSVDANGIGEIGILYL